MDVTLTSVSANRKLGKSWGRTPAFHRRLSELVAPLTHPDWEILQVVMHDRPREFVEVRNITKGVLGRLLQVGVGIPDDLPLLPADDARFIDACASQLSLAIRQVSMAHELRAELLKVIEQSRVETREHSVPRSTRSVRPQGQ